MNHALVRLETGEPPHSIEAEQSVLGGLLLENSAWAHIGTLTAEQFFNHAHRLIFGAIAKLIGAGTPADIITVGAALARQESEYGGMQYLNSLARSVPSAANLRRYAEIVQERAGLRALLACADRIRGAVFEQPERAHDIAREVAAEVQAAAQPEADGAWRVPASIATDEWTAAKLTPDCIVENYLYADVACLIAPGGTGKTTATLYEAVHIALARPLWRLRIFKPGPVLYVTSEDRREFLVARLREICAALHLTLQEVDTVRRLVRIDDCTQHPRRLTTVICDTVQASGFGSDIVAGCKAEGFAPVLVQFDPMVSFGVGESRINDAEQGLIEAARIVCGGLNACVRYVHHSGKGNAREKTLDQYSGRSGSALPDGTRMVAVMQPMTAAEWLKATAQDLAEGESAFVLARPKGSYCPPMQPPLYVRRLGYSFDTVTPAMPLTVDQQREVTAEQVWRLLKSELDAGRMHTRRSLDDVRPENVSRDGLRAAVGWLTASGRVVESDRPGVIAKGAHTYLNPDPGSVRGEQSAHRP